MSPKKDSTLVPRSIVDEALTRDLGSKLKGQNSCLAVLPVLHVPY